MKIRTLWIGLVVLILLSPLGLIIPDKLHGGTAWGEWSSDEVRELVGYVPAGMARLADMWKAPIPDYVLRGHEGALKHTLSVSYLISGLLGAAVVAGLAILAGRLLARNDKDSNS